MRYLACKISWGRCDFYGFLLDISSYLVVPAWMLQASYIIMARGIMQMRQEIERSEHGPRGGSRRAVSLKVLIERVCQVERVRVESVEGGGRRAELCRVREGIAYLWVEWLGRTGRQLAVPLGVRSESVYRAARRGNRDGERWRRLLESK